MSDNDNLKNLQAQIDALKQKTDPAPIKGDGGEAMSTGMRAGTELVTAIVGGALIGYGLDRWLDTKPWFLIVMLVLGVATGFLNVWRTTSGAGSAVGYKNLHEKQKNSLAKDREIRK